MVKLFCILNAFDRFEQKRVKTSNPLPSRRLSGLSVLFLFMLSVTRGKFLSKMATRTAFLKSDFINFRETRLPDPIEYVCCLFSTRRLQAQNRMRARVEKVDPTYFFYLFHLHPRRLLFCIRKRFMEKAAFNLGHKSTGPRTIFPNRRLGVDFRDRMGPLRFLCVCGHIFYGARWCPVKTGGKQLQDTLLQTLKVTSRCHTEASRACLMNTCVQGAGACS